MATKDGSTPLNDRMIEQTFDEVLGSPTEPEPAAEDDRPLAPLREDIFVIGVGSSGRAVGEGIVDLGRAHGQHVAAVSLDLIEGERSQPVVHPLPGYRYPEPAHLVLGQADDSLERARALYGEDAWACEMDGIPYADHTARRAGGGGYPAIGRAYFVAEMARVYEHLRRGLQQLRPAAEQTPAVGMDEWFGRVHAAERRRLRIVVAAGTAGCVGRSGALPVLAWARELAYEANFDVDCNLILVGGRPYGAGTDPVHDRIEENAESFFDELDEVVRTNRVRIGPDRVQLPSPALLSPGSVFYFDEDLADERGEIPAEARDRYLALVGFTSALAILSGASADADSIDSVLAPADAVIREVRALGHGVDRGLLARRREAERTTRTAQRLLDTLREVGEVA